MGAELQGFVSLISVFIGLWLGSLAGRSVAKRSSWLYGAPVGIAVGLIVALLLILLTHILRRF